MPVPPETKKRNSGLITVHTTASANPRTQNASAAAIAEAENRLFDAMVAKRETKITVLKSEKKPPTPCASSMRKAMMKYLCAPGAPQK
ncbi:hypothetical protein CQW49_19950 [Methylosinus trichosporium OB3b]|uniref:Uncharacterized protein n=1 Tax=Methylosinus trichosporium (strain ATCC 35070 / NCIMB 11131 / UNIQEM 75 / OB3b) TaxID=595536 RepID=A0A2D2D4L7_METT3|nr:hypothetical protein CQW49_19950 [Methylosinus trichosporium OB3b]